MKWSKLRRKLYFLLILWVFLLKPSYTLWITPQDFAKWKTLLRYISVVSFISVAYVVVKLKISKILVLIENPWNSPFLGFLALIPPNIVPSCWNFDQREFNKTNTLLGKSFKLLKFGSNKTHWKSTVLVHFGAQFTAGKPKILLKTKISAKTTSLGIPNNISARSQRNHIVLVKLSENLEAQIGSKSPPPIGLCQRVIRNPHIAYNRTFYLYFLYGKFQLLGICRSQLYPVKTTSFGSWLY